MVIPTIHNCLEELRPSLESILACEPAKLILVTTRNKHEALSQVVATLRMPDAASPVEISVLHVCKANKRLQVCKALEDDHVNTAITVLADDDVEWPPTLMPWLLAPFEDDRMGGVGTCQRVKRVVGGDLATRIFNWLGAAYIERRNFEISATHNIDGGTSCMSGRTGAYRTEIFKSYGFLENFKNERWGRCILNADDDNFVTRWLVAHQWKTWIQYERDCEVETTLENGMKFIYQCLRWARSNLRSNWKSLVYERHVWRYISAKIAPSPSGPANRPSTFQTTALVHVRAAYRHFHLTGLRDRPAVTFHVLVGYGKLGARKPAHSARDGDRVHVRLHQSGETGWAVSQESSRHYVSAGVNLVWLLSWSDQALCALHTQRGNL